MYKENDWLRVYQCPSCKALNADNSGALPLKNYFFASKKISVPQRGITVLKCRNCGLLYKDKVPSQSFVSKLIQNEARSLWSYQYNYDDEINLINNLINEDTSSYDLLDIGAADGNLLKLLKNNGGRRSALDVVRYPGLKISSEGEFIEGFLDNFSLSWSGDQYDIVTLFDVLEHLYNPVFAFSNLSDLVKKGGFIVIETGDTDKYWHKKEKISFWQYIRLFEHHIFWNKRAIVYQANRNGFELLSYVNKQNKYIKNIPPHKKIVNFLMIGLYLFSKRAYKLLGKLTHKQGIQPINLFARDHFRAVLRKVG